MCILGFQTPESVVKELIHSPADFYTFRALGIFFVSYFVISCVTYGMNISSGLFVPNLLLGALWGRILGMTLHWLVPEGQDPYDLLGPVGLYALMGAGAQLSGIVRMTFSLTAILVEATGESFGRSPLDLTDY